MKKLEHLKRLLTLYGLVLGGFAIGFSIQTIVDKEAFFITGLLLIFVSSFIYGQLSFLDIEAKK